MGFGFWRAIGWQMSGLFSRSALHLAHLLFHFLAGLKRDDKLLGHEHFIAGPGVASLARGTLFYLENTEISQLDAVVLDERRHDGIEGLLDDFLRLQLR